MSVAHYLLSHSIPFLQADSDSALLSIIVIRSALCFDSGLRLLIFGNLSHFDPAHSPLGCSGLINTCVQNSLLTLGVAQQMRSLAIHAPFYHVPGVTARVYHLSNQIVVRYVLCLGGSSDWRLSLRRMSRAFITLVSIGILMGQITIVLYANGWLGPLLVLHLVLHKDSLARSQISFVLVEKRRIVLVCRHTILLYVLVLRRGWRLESVCNQLQWIVVWSVMHADLILDKFSPLSIEFLLALWTAWIGVYFSILVVQLLISQVAFIQTHQMCHDSLLIAQHWSLVLAWLLLLDQVWLVLVLFARPKSQILIFKWIGGSSLHWRILILLLGH